MIEWPVIELARPWALLLLPLPLVALRWLPALPPPAALLVPAGVRELLVSMTSDGDQKKRMTVGAVLRVMGWVSLIIALAGPFTRGALLETPTGRDLMIALDLSSSMDEQDMSLDGRRAPRYDVVQRLIGAFIEKRRGDRVGLIAFGHEAFLIAPLSFDVNAVAATLKELTIGLPGHRTDLGRAVGLAVQSLRVESLRVESLRKEPSDTKVVLLLSDGEDNSGALTGLDAARLAKDHGVRIHSVGFTPNIDADGAAVLRAMATTTAGKYFVADSSAALDQVSAEIDTLEPTTIRGNPEYLISDWSFAAIVVAMLALFALSFMKAGESWT